MLLLQSWRPAVLGRTQTITEAASADTSPRGAQKALDEHVECRQVLCFVPEARHVCSKNNGKEVREDCRTRMRQGGGNEQRERSRPTANVIIPIRADGGEARRG